MNAQKRVTIITIPLICYHETIYWGLYTEHRGKIRNEILCRKNAGKQVSFAFERALSSEGDILIVADDKFGFEKSFNSAPSDRDRDLFLAMNSIPESWYPLVTAEDICRLVVPPADLSSSAFTFSERKLYSKSHHVHGLPGECANEWTDLLVHLSEKGYENIHAYIPKVCAAGICYATAYGEESGIWTKPIQISFTEKDSISSVYDAKEKMKY